MLRRGRTATAALGVGLAACGSDSGSSGGSSDTIIRGTTDQPVSLRPGRRVRPALLRHHLQRLPEPLQFPPGENEAGAGGRRVVRLHRRHHLRVHAASDGLKFSDGSTLTAEDVVFSFERNVDIADPNGASSLLANMKSIEAPDKDTVVFNLKEPDATWPLVLATGSFAIVPSDSLPGGQAPGRRRGDRLRPLHGRRSTSPASRPCCRRTTEYKGDDPAQTDHGDHPVLRQGLGAEARGRAGRRRRRLPQPLPDRPRGPRGRRRRQRRLRARARRSATSSSTSTCSRATTTSRSWRSARPSRRRSTASRSPTTSTTAPSSRCTR